MNSNRVTVQVVGGDISQIAADAVITAAYPTDGAKAFRDGETVFRHKLPSDRGAFGALVFVVDLLKKPLRELVLAGLQAANAAGCK